MRHRIRNVICNSVFKKRIEVVILENRDRLSKIGIFAYCWCFLAIWHSTGRMSVASIDDYIKNSQINFTL